MTADEVADALRARHPATRDGMAAAWTTVERFPCAGWGIGEIDFLAVSAWSSPYPWKPARVDGERITQPRMGYEIKVSRADLRTELLNPHKRAAAVAFCNRFYLAVPELMLTADEIMWDEPMWMHDRESWQRTPCRAGCYRSTRRGRWKGKSVVVEDGLSVVCPTCGGKGHEGLSRVELDAPKLWVPPDVGLVTISARGAHVAKEAPPRHVEPLTAKQLGSLLRWTSVRPDPRHAALAGQVSGFATEDEEVRPDAEVSSAA